MNIDIKKIFIKDQVPTVIYHQLDDNGKQLAEISHKDGSKCHRDFEKALWALAPHFAVMTGYIKSGDVPKKVESYKDTEQLVQNSHPHGYTIGGTDEAPGIVITGHRILTNGRAQNLNSPFYLFQEDDATSYKHMDHLIKLLEVCKKEAIEYMSGRKIYVDPQGALPFDAEETK